MPDNSRYKKGIWAERLACFCLILKGYFILATRYKTNVGEIDIVARRGRTIIFCEVKYRSDHDQGLFAISLKSQQRITRAATLFLQQKKVYTTMAVRFDALILSPPFSLKHVRNAWTS